MRRRVPAAALTCLAGVAALPVLAAQGQTTMPAATASPVALFKGLIRADRQTTPAIAQGLKAGRLFVDPAITFADLTGDGKQDAIATIDTGGAAGGVAVYVFSGDGVTGGALRAVYRSQSLYRATIRVQGTTLLVRTPDYQAGDELCCAKQLIERTLTWSPTARRVLLRSTRRVDVPVPAVGTAPTS